MYKKALIFAAKKHLNHKRKNGSPYIVHLIRVACEVPTERLKVIALLHDVVEDTDCTYKEISKHFGDEVMYAVECLTRRKGEAYAEYIDRLKINPNAVPVKIADIADNLSDSPSENAIKKSADALTKLLK